MFGTNTQQQQGGGLFGNNPNMGGGGGLFGGNTQAQTGSVFGGQAAKPFGAQGGGLFGGNTATQPNNPIGGTGGLFGGNQQQQPQQGGLFGGGQTQTTGGGLFGGQQQPVQQQGGLFGQQQPAQQQGGLFGGAQQTGAFGAPKTGGIFGGGQTQTTGGGIFGGSQPTQGGGLFGQPAQQQQPATGLFGGQTQQPPQQGGLFGATQPQQQGGLFGAPQQPQQSTGGLFGQPQQQQQGGGLFGQPQQQQGGIFGQPQQQQQTGGLFGATQQQPATGGLFGQQQPAQQQTGGLFGANQPKPGGLFGSQPQQPATGGLFGQQTQQQQTGGLFGATQPQQTTAWGQQPGFGQQQTNQLGGTSWGVNTTGITPQTNVGTQHPPVNPVKSKNPKVDNKHNVKCIAALDQYTGMSKQQIRCHFLLTGGFPASTGQVGGFGQQTTGGMFGKPQTTTPFGAPQATTGSLFGGQTSTTPSSSLFGQKPAGTSLFGATTQTQPQQGTSLFGGQQPTQQTGSLFGGQTQPQQGSLFGGQQPAQTGSLFGAQQPAQQTGSLFGQPQQPQGSLFGAQQPAQTGSLFGGQPAQQSQQSSLFGATQPAQTGGSLFGQQPAQTGSLFGQPQQQTGSLFGATQPQQQQGSLFSATQPQTGGSLFGGQTTGGLFGSTPQQGATGGSLFGGQQQGGSLFGAPQQGQPQTGGLFGAASTPGFGQQPQTNFFGGQNLQATPYANNLSMLTSIPLQSTILANESILDPNYNKASNNTLAIVLSALVNGGAISQSDADKLLRPTPFDQLVKKREQQLERQQKQEQLFKDMPSVFEDPMNFKKFQIPDDYFEMRRSSTYWAKLKEKQQSDRRRFSVVPQTIARPGKQKLGLSSLREQTDDASKIVRTKYASQGQLPITDQYTLKPSLLRLSKMTVQDLKQVYDVEIIGKYGVIKFLQPISLLYKQIDQCVDIKQDTIDITEPQWQNKKCQLTFFNFAHYREKSEKDKQKIEDKMYKWIQKNQEDSMQLVHFDQDEGTLVVTIH